MTRPRSLDAGLIFFAHFREALPLLDHDGLESDETETKTPEPTGMSDSRAACRADGLPSAAQPAGRAATAPAGGCVLSGETSRALLDLAALADATAAYAATCHAWVMETGDMKMEAPKTSAASSVK